MPTTKLGLPTITGNMSIDIVRDLNALSTAVDEKAGVAGGLAVLGEDGKPLNADGTPAGGGKTAAEISIADAGNYYTSANSEGALQEIGAAFAGARGSLEVNANGMLRG